MGQSGYGETFTTMMLGWIRGLASSIASMFQSNGGADATSGAAVLSWFSEHWLTLLIVLIVIGVLVDWIVWLIRWRPHWLWFGKRRIVLDDSVDELDGDLRYMDEPRFRSSVLARDDEYDEYDEYAQYDDDDDLSAYEDMLDEYNQFDEDPVGDYDEAYDDEGYEGEAYDDEDDGPYDDEADDDEAYDDPPSYDDDWDDAPGRKAPRRFALFGRRKRDMADEDPFAVDEDDFRGLDDDFYAVVSEEPTYRTASADEAAWADFDGDDAPDDEDELTGEIADDGDDALYARPGSRRARRRTHNRGE